jgi:hypothetical protein
VLSVGSSPYTEAYAFTPTDSTDYTTASGSATVNVAQASSSTTVSDAGGTYNGTTAFTASATATVAGGLNDSSAGDFTFDYKNTVTNADLSTWIETRNIAYAGNCRKLRANYGKCGIKIVECKKCAIRKPKYGLLLRFSGLLSPEWGSGGRWFESSRPDLKSR